jgi:hypothetical protein
MLAQTLAGSHGISTAIFKALIDDSFARHPAEDSRQLSLTLNDMMVVPP